MAIYAVQLNKTVETKHIVSALLLICCRMGEGDNVARLFGDEASAISPRQNIQTLPARTAKILSDISRCGLCFHVNPRGKNSGILIGKHSKILSKVQAGA